MYVIERGKVRQQLVGLGAHVGKLLEVVSGLNGNEILATTNLNQLATGIPVEVVPTSRADTPQDRSIAAAPPRGDPGGQE